MRVRVRAPSAVTAGVAGQGNLNLASPHFGIETWGFRPLAVAPAGPRLATSMDFRACLAQHGQEDKDEVTHGAGRLTRIEGTNTEREPWAQGRQGMCLVSTLLRYIRRVALGNRSRSVHVHILVHAESR